MHRFDRSDAFFVAISILFFIDISEFAVFGEVSFPIVAATAASFSIYMAAALLSARYNSPGNGASKDKASYLSAPEASRSGILPALLGGFALAMLVLTAYEAYIAGYLGYPFSAAIRSLVEYTVNFVLVLLAISLVAISSKIHSIKRFKRSKLLAFLFLAIAVSAVLAFYFSGALFYIINDETYIGIQSAKMLLSGINPYTQNVAQQLYSAFASNVITSPTITSTGTIVGTLGYPILYALTLLPFYNAHSSLHLVSSRLLPMEVGVFLALFILLLFFAEDFERKRTVMYGLILIMPFFVLNILSPTSVLLLILLVLALWKVESKYVGIVLGVAASVQQISWVPVLLVLLYIFASQGKKRGSLAIAATALVFLVINGYFIAVNGTAFIHEVFLPLSGTLIPGSFGIFGFPALLAGIKQSAISKLYFIALAFSAFGVLALKRKEAIGPLSMLPFAFMSHGSPFYYLLLATLTVVSFSLKSGGKASTVSKTGTVRQSKHARRAAAKSSRNMLAIKLIVLALMLLASASYLSMQRQTPSLAYFNTSMRSINGSNYYISAFATRGGAIEGYHVLLIGMGKGASLPALFGAFGEKILLVNGTPSYPGNYTFSVDNINPNTLSIGNSSRVNVEIFSGNSTVSRCIIYNSTAFLLCPIASLQSHS